MHLVLGSRQHCLDLTTFDNDIRKSGHYLKVNKPNRCYPLIFVGTVIAVGSVSNLMFKVLHVLFPDQAHFSVVSHSFTSRQVLVKDEH